MSVKYYVIFDNNYNVVKITTDVTYEENFFEIDKDEAAGFSIGIKSLQSYYVKQSALHTYELQEKQFANVEYMQLELLEAVKDKNDSELLIIHNSLQNCWKFKLSNKAKKIIQFNESQKQLKLYVSSTMQSNFLIRTLNVDINSLLEDQIQINFESSYENNLDFLTVYSKRYFHTIGIIHE